MNQRQKRYHVLRNQVQRLEKRLSHIRRLSDRYARIRLLAFGLGVVISGTVFLSWGAWPWLIATPFGFAPFIVAVYFHRQVDTAVTRFSVWLQLKQTHLARMRLDWEQIPAALPLTARLEHPFAIDLDLVGDRSLHQLLDTAVTREGSQRLQDWLLETRPDRQHILIQQARIQELTHLTLFREKLILQAKLVTQSMPDKYPAQRLLDLLHEHKDRQRFRPLLDWLLLLAAINILLFILNLTGVLPAWWLLPWILYALIYAGRGIKLTAALFDESLLLQNGLDTLFGVFQFLESQPLASQPHIRTLCAPFLETGERPSAHIRRVRRVITGVGIRQNPFAGILLNALVPWDVYFAYRMAQCKADLAHHLPIWLDVWFELEALNSLATFAYLNPDEVVFPEVTTEVGASHFHTRQIGHPLIASEQRVGNDFQIDKRGAINLITGSNMAGKSSFLRTLGVNLVLAYAGAPVVAHSLRTSLFRLFASIRVTDSLTDGYSFFYAEVRRLKQLLLALQADEKRPLFFLIDEIFQGTNNRERLIGSRATIRALAQGHGVGVIATHDLELVHLADEIPTVRNFHFRDDVADGRMVFDYKLHAGPCPTTNALKIMRLAGLPVEIP